MIHEYQIWKDGKFDGAIKLYSNTKEEISKALGIAITSLEDTHPHHDKIQINNNITLDWIATIY